MKIETRKRKRATQKVKANFSLVQRASVLFLLFKRKTNNHCVDDKNGCFFVQDLFLTSSNFFSEPHDL